MTVILFPLEYADHKTHAAAKDEILDAYVRIDVEWNNYDPGKSNISQTGFFFVEVRGTIIQRPDIDPFFYAPKNLVANYNYQDKGVYVRYAGPCPELYSEQKGSGVVRILDTDEVEDPTKDGVLTITAASGWEQSLSLLKELKGKGRTPGRQKPIDKELKTDIYTFVLTVPMATTLAEQSSPCSRYKTSPWSTGVALAPYLNLTKRGMAGSYSWTSNTLDTGLQIRDYPGQTQFEPQKGEGNVKYRVSWNFGKPEPMVKIWWEGKDVTDKHQNVVVGEKIELKAVVYPEDKDPKRGDWTVPGKFIKNFIVQGQEGRVEHLEGNELKKPEVKFHWWKEGESLVVKYTTTVDGKKLEAQTTFIVKKPNIPMKAEISPGQFDVANVTTPTAKGGKSVIELYYVTPGNRAAITFTRDPIKDFPGETEYIQLVNVNAKIKSHKDSLTPCLTIQKEGLDGGYPYPSKDGGITATDNPGVPVAMSLNLEISVKYNYKMFLMYKPYKEGAIFIPLKRIKWHWHGFAKRQRVVDDFNFKDSEVGLDSQEQEANEYPTWKVISSPGDQWSACSGK